MTQEATAKKRKDSINKNKFGSVRNVNGMVYVDFMYLGERVREQSNYVWSDENAKIVRDQLDRIDVAIKSGDFRFSKVFQNSKHRAKFDQLERQHLNRNPEPDQVRIGEYIDQWLKEKADSGHITGRTVLYYKSIIQHHLEPYFANLCFSEINANEINRFYAWCRNRKFDRGLKPLSNNTLNKAVVAFKLICKDAAVEYGWGAAYNPFFGFKNLSMNDPIETISPFTLDEQQKILKHLPKHWKPYFKFAFASGLRQGEQLAIKASDIDWGRKTLTIRTAFTRDQNGKIVEGPTKNKFSRRIIHLIPVMYDALKEQKQIYERIGGEYFFMTPTGKAIDCTSILKRVWIQALQSANVEYRPMKQTRHTFATVALSMGENPLWISKVLGHRDTKMIIKTYTRYVDGLTGREDGLKVSEAFSQTHHDV